MTNERLTGILETVAQIGRLQDQRDYADEVEAAKLTAEIGRLLNIIDPQPREVTL